MAASDIRKNFTLNVDGRGYAGKITEFNAPELAQKMEEFRAGGMNMPIDIDMGMEKLAADFSMIEYNADVLALFGLVDGSQVQITAREVLESVDGTVTAVIHSMRGKVNKTSPGTSKAGDVNAIKYDLSLSYYKLQHGARVLQEIDAINMVHVVNGTDILAAKRAALGM